jgi:SAM-dependent methyltransferase
MSDESDHASADRTKFDAFAADYVDVQRRNISISGEDPEYFAQYKVRCLDRLVGPTFDDAVLDYGCGVGLVTQQLRTRFSTVHGFDPSQESVSTARQRTPDARFFADRADVPGDHYGLVVMSGVLHHVHRSERSAVVEQAIGKLRRGGRLVVFEHNPFNPLTRRAVAMCPFDDDAVLLWPREVRRLLAQGGLRDVRRDFIVFLPRALGRLRWMEPYLRAVPLGAQVMVVGTRPS